MINVLFFGSLGDRLRCSSMQVEAGALQRVGELREQLIGGGLSALEDERILSACNQQMCDGEQAISDGDEIAFFPPVTGG